MTSKISQGIRDARSGVAPSGSGPRNGALNRARKRSKRNILFVMLLPSAALLIALNFYPLLSAASQSLHSGNLLQAGQFVGLQNYTNLLSSSEFWNAAWFTVVFTVVGVFGSWAVGLGLALLLRTRIPARGIFKVLLILPWVVPIVVSAMAWNWLVATPTSLIPSVFHAIGLGRPAFLADPFLAKVIVCVFKVWIAFPFMMLMSSAALSAVEPILYEAASIDGATRWQQFTRITLPMISRSTYISWILMMIFCVNDFPTIYLLTGGGPVHASTTLVVLAYQLVFEDFLTGPGTAVAFMMTIALGIVSVLLFRMIRKSSRTA
jgi:multiple sugar transport system permease protein